jgi:hypothetical protein
MGQDPNPASFEFVSIDLTEAISGKSVGYPNKKVCIQYTKKKCNMVTVCLYALVLILCDFEMDSYVTHTDSKEIKRTFHDLRMVAAVFCFRTDVIIVLTVGSNAINISKQADRHAYLNEVQRRK